MIPLDAGESYEASPEPPASAHVTVIARRADFLRAAQGRRHGTPGFLLQALHRPEQGTGIRVGFTCSKKLGNAVMRNRAKRRLRAVAQAVLPRAGRPGWDYVLVGRPGSTVDRAFSALLGDLASALAQVHRTQDHVRRGPQ